MALPLNGHAANEPMSISSRTHQVKKPFAIDSGVDYDFTGLVVVGLGDFEIGDVARLSLPNVFQKVNTIPGIRFETKVVIVDYNMSSIDFSISADASAGPITVTLPMALGSGQFYHVSKVDDSLNPVYVVTATGDLINGQDTFILPVQYADLGMIDARLANWDRFGVGPGPTVDLSDVAFKSSFNNFLDLNKFTGVQFSTRTVDSDDEFGPLDFTILADAAANPITLQLPNATGSGQIYHAKKIDTTEEILTIQAQAGDLIDGSISVNTWNQWGNVLLQDAAPGYWDNIGVANALLLPDPAPATPTTLNQVIALLQSYGLCE